MTKRVAWIALAVAVVSLAGCGQLSVLSDGRVALEWGEPTTAAELLGAAGGQPARASVLHAFDAAEGGAGGASDPNSRAGANCSGGVCAIF